MQYENLGHRLSEEALALRYRTAMQGRVQPAGIDTSQESLSLMDEIGAGFANHVMSYRHSTKPKQSKGRGR